MIIKNMIPRAAHGEDVRWRSVCWQNRNVSALANTLLQLPKSDSGDSLGRPSQTGTLDRCQL